MGAAEHDPADQPDAADESADPPLTVEVLAHLQAGLPDDDAAARLRRLLRADPAAERAQRALDRVRFDVAALGADPTSAPDAPPAVVARIAAALRSAAPAASSCPRGHATHAARPTTHPAKVLAAVAGLGAFFAAIGLGTAALVTKPMPTPSTPVSAQHITVPDTAIALSDAQVLGLLDRSPDYGPLTDPARRTSCLNGLGYPTSTRVLGAQPIEINRRRGVLLVLPAERPDELTMLVVAPGCSAADTELLASTHIRRP
jgi:hypothetical protein